MKLSQKATDMQLQPFNILLQRTLAKLEEMDPLNIFSEPVAVDEVKIIVYNRALSF